MDSVQFGKYSKPNNLYIAKALDIYVAKGYSAGTKCFFTLVIEKFETISISSGTLYVIGKIDHSIQFSFTMIQIKHLQHCFVQHRKYFLYQWVFINSNCDAKWPTFFFPAGRNYLFNASPYPLVTTEYFFAVSC